MAQLAQQGATGGANMSLLTHKGWDHLPVDSHGQLACINFVHAWREGIGREELAAWEGTRAAKECAMGKGGLLACPTQNKQTNSTFIYGHTQGVRRNARKNFSATNKSKTNATGQYQLQIDGLRSMGIFLETNRWVFGKMHENDHMDMITFTRVVEMGQ